MRACQRSWQVFFYHHGIKRLILVVISYIQSNHGNSTIYPNRQILQVICYQLIYYRSLRDMCYEQSVAMNKF